MPNPEKPADASHVVTKFRDLAIDTHP